MPTRARSSSTAVGRSASARSSAILPTAASSGSPARAASSSVATAGSPTAPVAGGTSNNWMVVAVAPQTSGISTLPIAAVLLALIALALAMGRRWSRTSEQAETDPLTGLGNRRKLDADLSRLLPASRRVDCAHAVRLRPQRVQELQRRVRPSGRRRAAGALRLASRGCRRPTAPRTASVATSSAF